MVNAFVDKFATFQEFFISLFIQRHCVTPYDRFLVSLCDIYKHCNMVMGHFFVPALCFMHLRGQICHF